MNNLFRTHGWRAALIASGVTMLAGAPRHPSSDPGHALREELAIMTAHPDWVPAHVAVLLSTILLAAGLLGAYRQNAWPGVRRALGFAAVAVAVYVIETAFHLAAVLDSDALHHGGSAPIATTHIGLSVLMYPATGLAVAWLGLRQLTVWRGARRFTGLAGIGAGLAQAVSVPLTLILPDAELSPIFAASAMLYAGYALVTGLSGAPRPALAATTQEPVTV